MKPTVSIITPCYNCEKWISETIESVLNQTFKDYEMLIVDDMSTDETKKIVTKYQAKDNRIKLINLNKKGGASGARNKALELAQGRYIAFLDGDDLWKPTKLEKQIEYMQKNGIAFSYTDYEYIDENGKPLNIIRIAPKKMSYIRMLIGDSVGCLTVIYDSSKTGKIKIPTLEKRNDYALWCLILKKIKKGYKYNDSLSLYRKNIGSLSAGKKTKLLKYHYDMHRKVNQFNPILATFFTLTNGFNYIINKTVREKNIDSTKRKKI